MKQMPKHAASIEPIHLELSLARRGNTPSGGQNDDPSSHLSGSRLMFYAAAKLTDPVPCVTASQRQQLKTGPDWRCDE